MTKIIILSLFFLPIFSFAQSDSLVKFYEVSLVPFSVESSEIQPRTLTQDEILYISQLREEKEIVVIDLDLYTRVKIYPINKIAIQTEEK